MTHNPRKDRIIAWVESLEDDHLLQALEYLADQPQNIESSNLIVSDPKLEPGTIYQLSPEEEKLLLDARQEILDGHFYTQEEVDRMTEEWLKQ